jgi:hypothetical protein
MNIQTYSTGDPYYATHLLETQLIEFLVQWKGNMAPLCPNNMCECVEEATN